MASALERAVDSLSDPDVSIADALRRLLVVSHRISAEDLSAWIKAELDGYSDGQDVPEYRQIGYLPVTLRFDGYGGSSDTLSVSPGELPSHLSSAFADGALRQPVAELDALCEATAESEPRMKLPIAWVMAYRQLAEQDRVPHYPMMILNDASLALPRTHLRGILDRVKSVALDLALGLEDVSLRAGAAGGPTVESEPELAATVTVHLNQIFATNSSIAVGGKASAVNVQVGDLSGLLEAARSLLSEEGVTALAAAIKEDGGEPSEKTRSFLDHVRGGAYLLGTGMATNAAYEGLVHLIGTAFPGFSL